MSYDSSYLMIGRGVYNAEGIRTAPSLNTYSTADTLADVVAASYFPSYFGFSSENFQDGDFLYVYASDDYGVFVLTEVATTPVLSVNLTPSDGVTQVGGSFPLQFTGPWAVQQTGTIDWLKTGNILTLQFPEITAAHTDTDQISSFTGMSPVFRPDTYDRVFPFIVVNNGIDVPGQIGIATNGSIEIATLTTTNGVFDAGTVGFRACTVTYELDLA